MLRKILPLLLLLAACGQKGPLYLPQEAAVPAQPVATAAPAPAENNGQEESGKEEQESTEEQQPQTTGATETSEGPAVEK